MSPTGSSDTTDYEVGADNTAIVQAAETLGHFADWTQVDSQTLRLLNKLHKNGMVPLGKKIKLNLSKVSAEIRQRSPRLSSSPAGGLLCLAPDRRHGNLCREARRLVVDDCSAEKRSTGVAGDAV